MDADITGTALWDEVSTFFERALTPGAGRPMGADDPRLSPDGATLALVVTLHDDLEHPARRRIALVDLNTPAPSVSVVTTGPHDDWSPRWSPDGATLAFLSDPDEVGCGRLFYLRPDDGAVTPGSALPGSAEQIAWAPGGDRLLVVVASPGAERAGGHGSGVVPSGDGSGGGGGGPRPTWLPRVESAIEVPGWRRLVIVDVASGAARTVQAAGVNVWEAAWLDEQRIAAVVSDDPSESSWYEARLAVVDTATEEVRTAWRGRHQVALPTPSPDGRCIALIHAFCSDRDVVAGELVVVDVDGGAARTLDTAGVDVTHLSWVDAQTVSYAGQRGLRTVVAEVGPDGLVERWDTDASTGVRYPFAERARDGSYLAVMEAYTTPPAVVRVIDGRAHVVCDLANEGHRAVADVGGIIEPRRWRAPDGVEIEGLLARPRGEGPHPLIVQLHGGPVWSYRNRWCLGSLSTPLLVARGYAVLHPNPRGSSGRGLPFAECLARDMGGVDVGDVLAGVDHLVEAGIADDDRVGVTGTSYGGFLAAWLATTTDRFRAAVPVAPITDWASFARTSNIVHFARLFLDGALDDPASQYVTRSPVAFADKASTATLLIAGNRDRCTPPGQAEELYRALLDARVPTALVVYPEEGHGIRGFPAVIDANARVLWWFDQYLAAVAPRHSVT